jgi:hypothetical protein
MTCRSDTEHLRLERSTSSVNNNLLNISEVTELTSFFLLLPMVSDLSKLGSLSFSMELPTVII